MSINTHKKLLLRLKKEHLNTKEPRNREHEHQKKQELIAESGSLKIIMSALGRMYNQTDATCLLGAP